MQQEEILNYILAGSIIVLTAMLAVLMFYLISIARNIRWFVKGAKDNAVNVLKSIDAVKEKIERSVSHLGFIADAAKNLLSYLLENKVIKRKKRK